MNRILRLHNFFICVIADKVELDNFRSDSFLASNSSMLLDLQNILYNSI